MDRNRNHKFTSAGKRQKPDNEIDNSIDYSKNNCNTKLPITRRNEHV
jgi:hypothetical protein